MAWHLTENSVITEHFMQPEMTRKSGLKYGEELTTAGRLIDWFLVEHPLALFSCNKLSITETFGYLKFTKNESKKYLP